MKPLKLVIEGLYSYQTRQEIDFSKLTEAHLFGIFGSVGSGKSSVLEAVTFALYGQTDKLNKKDNRAYNMMNLKSDKLYIEFIFEVEENEYQIIVKAKRKKRYSEVTPFDRTFYKKVGGEWIPTTEEEIHQSIGLSYENFKRTIIIPQGQFKEFLELGDTDRTRMLKELFNLGKFDLADKLKPLISKNLTETNVLKGQLEQLGDVNTEQLKEMEQLLVALNKEIAELNKELTGKQKESVELDKLKELKAKKEKIEEKLVTLNAKKEEYKSCENKIKDYEECSLKFKPLFDEDDRLGRQITALEKEISEGKKQSETLVASLTDKKKAFERLKVEYDERAGFKERIDELKRIEQIFSLKGEAKKNNEGIEHLDKQLKQGEQKISADKKAGEELVGELEKLKKEMPDLLLLSEVKEWYIGAKTIRTGIEETSTSIKNVDKEIAALLKEAAVCCNISDEQVDLKGAIEGLEKEKTKLKESLKPIEEELDRLSVQKKIGEYAAQLEEGKACPLCGSTEHPSIMNSEEVGGLLLSHKEKKQTIEKGVVTIEEKLVKLQNIKTRTEAKEEQKSELRAAYTKKTEEQKAHKQSFTWKKYTTRDELVKTYREVEQKQKLIAEKEKQVTANREALEKLTLAIEKTKSEHNEARSKASAIKAKTDTLSAMLKQLKLDDFAETSKSEIEQQCGEWEKAYNKIEHDYNSMNTQIESLQKQQSKLAGEVQANMKAHEKLKTEKCDVELAVKEKVAASKYDNEGAVKLILSETLDTQKERLRIEAFVKELSSAENELKQLKAEIDNRKYDESKHAEIKRLITVVAETRDKKNSEKGKIERDCEKLNEALKRLKDFKKKQQELENRAADLDTLRKMFASSGFVNYVSSVHLNNLCEAANERFHKLTGQKLRLEITENNNFQVRDYMNGGNVRSVKTLSGGQSFQASLSLALALTDSIQKFTKSDQNFFFLDEGFGSLDKKALSIVFEALKSLKKENRVVGVISHVEELQQEMGVYVKVKNDTEQGSLLKFSWEE